jgi:hypothetical protein
LVFLLSLGAGARHVGTIQKMHLRDLMADADRCKAMTAYDLATCARDISSLCVRACVWIPFA